MTLHEWQKKKRQEGTWAWIEKQFGYNWSVRWLKEVFYGKRKPGCDLFLEIKGLTGLSDAEIVESYNDQQR